MVFLKCFPRLVSECVFQHLNPKELIEVSEVDTQWNEFVSERPQVGRLELVFNKKDDALTDEV